VTALAVVLTVLTVLGWTLWLAGGTHLHHWRTCRVVGRWRYVECRRCHVRDVTLHARLRGLGHQPIDWGWVRTGAWGAAPTRGPVGLAGTSRVAHV
jgi:hypothetical protein